MSFAGLDGYRNGWVAVHTGDSGRRIEFLPRIEQMMEQRFERAAIDIPIGLPD